MEMDKKDWQVYMKHIYDDQKKPISWNEKVKRWEDYLKTREKDRQPKRSKTSFDMNKY